MKQEVSRTFPVGRIFFFHPNAVFEVSWYCTCDLLGYHAEMHAVADCMTALQSLPCDLQPEFLSLIPSSWVCRTLSRPRLLYSLWTWKSHCRKLCYYSNRIQLPESKPEAHSINHGALHSDVWGTLISSQMMASLSNSRSNSYLRSLTNN